MSRFTRLTLVGSQRRAEVVVPSDEGFAAMLPQLLDLLDERSDVTPRAVTLVRVTGDQVDLALDCAEQDLADGEVLRVVRAADAPPPPEVADVTDATAEELAVRPGRWTVRTRQAVAAGFVGVAAAVAGTTLGPAIDSGSVHAAVLAGAALLALLVAAPLGRVGRRYAGLVLTAAAVGLAVPIALALAADEVLAGGDAGRIGLLVAWLALGLGVGLGRRDRGALAGAALGVTLTGLDLLLGLVLPTIRTDALLATVGIVACGLLPWYAMSASGLTGLDDEVLDGATPQRTRVRVTLDDAYRALTWSTVAVAVTVALATIGLLGSGSDLARALALVVVAVVALRTRTLPLRWQVVTLWAAVVVPLAVLLLGGLEGRSPTLAAGLAVAAALVMAVAAGLEPSGQQRARLRRLGDLVELLGVLAILPLLLGVFGVYGDLLRTF
ncbi:EsaB/YukD family protein [Cellulomonas fimi]|uniref:Type VII secretion integral membrane protein EccD n=1 Tax=Cellulomonas fimi TaxID=1708 RepID=A0A7Y0M0Z3_CELFI|nr:EsaB/YukD family protein [Cellulomonas fimi]NMR21606.1 type VII secretion integral membrane protein EccD [Cellulomonas fimi]